MEPQISVLVKLFTHHREYPVLVWEDDVVEILRTRILDTGLALILPSSYHFVDPRGEKMVEDRTFRSYRAKHGYIILIYEDPTTPAQQQIQAQQQQLQVLLPEQQLQLQVILNPILQDSVQPILQALQAALPGALQAALPGSLQAALPGALQAALPGALQAAALQPPQNQPPQHQTPQNQPPQN